MIGRIQKFPITILLFIDSKHKWLPGLPESAATPVIVAPKGMLSLPVTQAVGVPPTLMLEFITS